MPANNSSTHHYLLIFKSQFYVNNKQIHLEADPSAHRLHRHSHRHHPRRHQLHGHVMTIAAGINHDARPFSVKSCVWHSMQTPVSMTKLTHLLHNLRFINHHSSIIINQCPFPIIFILHLRRQYNGRALDIAFQSIRSLSCYVNNQ